MAENRKMTSLIMQRMMERSNNERNRAAVTALRDEERAFILSEIKDSSAEENEKCYFYHTVDSTIATSKDADKRFHCMFPWNKLTFEIADSSVSVMEECKGITKASPVKEMDTNTSPDFKETVSHISPKSTESSVKDFINGHSCSKTSSSSVSSKTENTSVNKSGHTEFSDCFYCNAMLMDDVLSKWKKAVSSESKSSDAVTVNLICNETVSNTHHKICADSINKNITIGDSFNHNLKTKSETSHSRSFTGPVRTSSPELQMSTESKYLSILDQQESGASTETLSTIPDKRSYYEGTSDSPGKNAEQMFLYVAEIVEEDCKEEKTTQLLDAPSYDLDLFLKDALGDEMDYSSCSEMIDPPEVMEENYPVDYGGKLFHTLKGYRMLSNRLQQKVRPHLSTSTSMRMCFPESLHTEKQLQSAVQALFSKADLHKSIIAQTSKAIEFCTMTKEFTSSLQRVECERLLLLSTYKRNAAYDEIHRLKFEDTGETSLCFEKGTVVISEISLKLKSEFLDRSTNDIGMNKIWFVCLMSQSDKVFATEAVSYITDDSISFSGSYTFSELQRDFMIRIQVFSLRLRKHVPGHAQKNFPSIPMTILPCPVPCKKVKSSCKKLGLDICEKVKAPDFLLAGELHLQLHDVHFSKPWPLHKVTLASPLIGTIDMDLRTSVTLTSEYSGFLNLCSESYLPLSWQKYWFYLKEYSLKYWNYPTDKDEKDPVGKIDLCNCVSKNIGPACRSICPRARSFVIETHISETAVIHRYFLSADTITEMDQWCYVLNKVIKSLRDWNIRHNIFD